MSIETTDIKVYLSGGAENTDPDDSIGGAISTTELTDDTLHNLFAKVTAAEALAGSTKYRAVFFKNEHATLTWEAVKAYIDTQTTSEDTSIEIGVAAEGKNSAIEAIADEDTAPEDVVFTATTTPASGEDVPDLEAGDYIGIWVKRIVDAEATATASDSGKPALRGETT